jgi:hypothetical protein
LVNIVQIAIGGAFLCAKFPIPAGATGLSRAGSRLRMRQRSFAPYNAWSTCQQAGEQTGRDCRSVEKGNDLFMLYRRERQMEGIVRARPKAGLGLDCDLALGLSYAFWRWFKAVLIGLLRSDRQHDAPCQTRHIQEGWQPALFVASETHSSCAARVTPVNFR